MLKLTSISSALAALMIAALLPGCGGITVAPASPPIASVVPTTTKPVDLGYNDPRTLEVDLKTKLNDANAKSPTLKGVTATDVVCVSSGEHLFDCSFTMSDPALSTVHTYLVAADGKTFVSKAGQ